MAYSNEDPTLITVNVHWDADKGAIRVVDLSENGFITIDIGQVSLFIDEIGQLEELFSALAEANDCAQKLLRNRHFI